MTRLLLCVLLVSCAHPAPVRFGPDPYTVECINGETWIVSEHGRVNLGDECTPQGE